MPRIRCPECDHSVKIDADDERSSVRCDECGYKIRIDDAEDSCNGAAKKRPLERKKNKSGGMQSALAKNWMQLIPVAIVIPIGLLFLALGLFVSAGGALAVIFGFVVSFGAFIWASVLVFKDGNYISPDYLEFLGPAKWLVILGMFGLYVLGYIALLYVGQVMTVIKKPMLMGPWIFLQAYGVFLMIAGPIVYGVGFARPRPPEFGQMNQQNQRPDLNLGGNPINPPPNLNKDKEEEPFLPPPNPNKDKGEDPFNPPPKKKIEEPVQPPPKVTGDEALDRLLDDLGSKNTHRAARQLASMQPNQHRPVVAKALANQLQAVRVFDRTPILNAMQVWATPEQVPLLLQFLEDQDINTRNEVMQVLGKVKDVRAVAPLVKCLQALQTQYHAERSLREMGPIAEKELWPLLSQKTPDARALAVRILKDIGTVQSIPALQQASQEFTLQFNARQAIQAIQARGQK